MTNSQGEVDCRNREPSPAIVGSCCSGIQRSGGNARTVSPKNPAAATPMTVNGRPSSTSVEPTTDGSDP